MTITMRKAAVSAVLVLLTAAGLTGCIPNPSVTCDLTTGRVAVQSCIDGNDAVKLVGIGTWTANTVDGLVVPAGKTVVLAADAQVNVRYTANNENTAAVYVEGTFYMSPGSKVTNHRSTGMPSTPTWVDEKRMGIHVKNGGNAQIIEGTVLAAGYAVKAGQGASNTLGLSQAVVWGLEGVVSGPNNSTTNYVTVANSVVVGQFRGVVIEPVSATAKTKFTMSGTQVEADGNNVGHFFTHPDIPNGPTNKVLTSDSSIHDNTSSNPSAYVYVWGCQGNLFSNNGFAVSQVGC